MNVHETQVSINRKNLLRERIIGNRCNVLLQVSSHVTILLMFDDDDDELYSCVDVQGTNAHNV